MDPIFFVLVPTMGYLSSSFYIQLFNFDSLGTKRSKARPASTISTNHVINQLAEHERHGKYRNYARRRSDSISNKKFAIIWKEK